MGLSGAALATVLHHWLVGPAVPHAALVAFVAGVEIYCFVSWGLLFAFWERTKERIDLPFVLLVLDVVVCVIATYVTGAERSWLFFIIVIRLTDASYGIKRALALAHMAPLLYVAMLWYVIRFDGRSIPFGPAAVNTFTLYATALYFAVTGRAVRKLRARVVSAVRMSRELIAQLQEKSERLEVSMEQASAASRAKARLLATVSHELRTPLTGIIAQTEMVIDEADPEKDAGLIADLGEIVVAARQLSGVVDNLLEVSRIGTDQLMLQVELVDVVDLTNEVSAEVAPLMSQGGNRFDVTHDAALGTLRTDRARLRQVLLALLGNAAKFTSSGTITLDVRRTDEDTPAVVFRVSDTGIGIAEEIRPTLFHPFAQGDTSSTRKYGGTGLGLVIAKRYAELISARLSYETSIGVGTTFTLVVPADAHAPVGIATSSSGAASSPLAT